MSELFKPSNTKYNLRNSNSLVSNTIKTSNYGLETVSYLAPRIWEQIPEEIKQSKTLRRLNRGPLVHVHVGCARCTRQISVSCKYVLHRFISSNYIYFHFYSNLFVQFVDFKLIFNVLSILISIYLLFFLY